MRELWATCRALVSMSWRQDRDKTVVAAVLMLTGALAAPLAALSLRLLVDAAVAHQPVHAAVAGFALAVLAIMSLTFNHFAHIAYFELAELHSLSLDERLIELSHGSTGLAHLERHGYADRLTVVQREIHQFRSALQSLLSLAGLALATGTTAVLLALLDPVLLALPLLALPALLMGGRAERIVARAKLATAGQTRVALGLFRLTARAETAQELRACRMADELVSRHSGLWDHVTEQLCRAQFAAAALRAAGQLIFAAGYVGAIALVVGQAAAGRRTVGDVLLVVVLAVQVSQQVSSGLGLVQDLQRMATAFRQLDAMSDETAREITVHAAARSAAIAPAVGALAPAPPRIRRGIELRDVSFRYPGTSRFALRGADLVLPAGATVALVGENGAGKSTLIKLLCGFYQPDQGSILIDGEDLRGVRPQAWQARIAAGFQDFVRFELTAREAVGVGDLPRLPDEAAVRDALRRAQAQDVIASLEDGLDTRLGRSHPDGTELSGGQWQKLAIGRALMREEPLLLVLDEPNSALDAAAEHSLFERYAAWSRETARRTGAVTLFVTHRLSTVRSADLIVVMADGAIAQVGSHDEFMRTEGLYRRLYSIQQDAYQP